MNIISDFYRITRLFSIDIAAGAVGGCVLMAHILDARVPITYLLILFASTVVVYSTDHIADGFRKKGKANSQTHNFFYEYRIPLFVSTLFLGILIVRLAFYMLGYRILELGIILGTFLIVYFIYNYLNQKSSINLFFVKEVWITLIYSFAVIGGPVILSGGKPSTGQILLIISYVFIVFSNVLIYSYYEYEIDLSENESSFATVYGVKNCRIVIFISLLLAGCLFLASEVFLTSTNTLVFFIYTTMVAGLFFVVTKRNYFEKNKIYGKTADGLFLIPFTILLI